MKLKLDDKGAVTVQDGKPVYLDDDGKEIAFDAPATRDTISRLNAEAKAHREGKEAFEAKLKAFEGIDDPAKALKALETLKNLDDKKLIDAGEVERVKAEAKAAFDDQLKAQEKKYKPIQDERDSLRNQLHQEKLGTAFNRSKYIQDKMAIPVDLVQARFGNSFAVDGNKIVAKDTSGNPVYSRSNPGNLAEFDEALEILVDSYPYRDNILKGTGASGGGATGTKSDDGKRTMTKAMFDTLAPAEKMKAAKEMTIVA